MKKVFLLIVLSCLFISCKNHVSSNQGNNHEEELLPTQVKITNYCEELRINSAYLIFCETDLEGERKIFILHNSTLNYGESKIFDIFEIPDGHIPAWFVCEIENLTTGQIYSEETLVFRSVFYEYLKNKKFRLNNSKKFISLTSTKKLVFCATDF